MLDARDFEDILEKRLKDIADKIEMYDEESTLQIDYIDGVLNINSSDGKELTLKGDLNKQCIIIMSPSSDNNFYEYIEDEEDWIDVDGNSLCDILKEELKEEFYINVKF